MSVLAFSMVGIAAGTERYHYSLPSKGELLNADRCQSLGKLVDCNG
jgi:hypothetical protein